MVWGLVALLHMGTWDYQLPHPSTNTGDFLLNFCIRVSFGGRIHRTFHLKTPPLTLPPWRVSVESGLMRRILCFGKQLARASHAYRAIDRSEPSTDFEKLQLYRNHGLSCGVSWPRACQAGRTRTAVGAGATLLPKAWQRALGRSLKTKGCLAPYRDMDLNGLV